MKRLILMKKKWKTQSDSEWLSDKIECSRMKWYIIRYIKYAKGNKFGSKIFQKIKVRLKKQGSNSFHTGNIAIKSIETEVQIKDKRS